MKIWHRSHHQYLGCFDDSSTPPGWFRSVGLWSGTRAIYIDEFVNRKLSRKFVNDASKKFTQARMSNLEFKRSMRRIVYLTECPRRNPQLWFEMLLKKWCFWRCLSICWPLKLGWMPLASMRLTRDRRTMPLKTSRFMSSWMAKSTGNRAESVPVREGAGWE